MKGQVEDESHHDVGLSPGVFLGRLQRKGVIQDSGGGPINILHALGDLGEFTGISYGLTPCFLKNHQVGISLGVILLNQHPAEESCDTDATQPAFVARLSSHLEVGFFFSHSFI